MKHTLLLVILMACMSGIMAGQLVLINYGDQKELKSHFAQSNLSIHYYTEEIVIATAPADYKGNFMVIEANGMKLGQSYYIAWFHKQKETQYISTIEADYDILLESDQYLIIRANEDEPVHPPHNGRISRISASKLQLTQKKFNYTKGSLMMDPEIEQMMEEVDTNIFLNNLQHLQDYGTRNAYEPESVEAQNWIKAQLESYGYSVELFDFTMPGGPASDNVIATKPGTVNPDEYVVIGAHYDSYSWSGSAPGADDNGTGTCGVMEVARVMADFDTDRTVIFCAWSGEEYGLYGSEAWANWAAGDEMNILGYFNIDMCGYRHPGDPIHTDMIAPSSAQPLVDFYTDVCAMYLPDFIVNAGNLTGGDSDHTSFNNAGYMGIFPFEDSQNYSPYIHTSGDVIGTSVNSLEMCMMFTQAMVANVATMANWLSPPQNLVAMPGDAVVELAWESIDEADSYNVYKNSEPIPVANVTDPSFTDEDVENLTTYTYYVTAIYSGSGDESDPSNMVTVTPLPPMAFPFSDDFESGALYWNFEESWGLSTNQSYSPDHSMTESPVGNYPNDMEASTTLYSFSLENAVSAELSFFTKYDLETNYDYTWLEITTDGTNWTELDEFNGLQSTWTQMSYSLEDYLGEPFVSLRFRFYSDTYVTEDGMYIDDLLLDVENSGVGILNQSVTGKLLEVMPNPFSSQTTIRISPDVADHFTLLILNAHGEIVKSFTGTEGAVNNQFIFDGKELAQGIYFCKLIVDDKTEVEKIILTR